MKILGDYHTHTTFSKFKHGKNTIQEMVDAAEKAGLKEIAITDHGHAHLFGITRKNLLRARRQIDEINKTSNVKVLLGMECNLLGFNGRSDLLNKYKDLLDIRLIGFHRALVWGWGTYIFFLLAKLFIPKKRLIQKNTDAYIKAIKIGDFDIITHPQEYIKVDIKRLASACAENNTYLEINNRHCVYTQDDIKKILETDVKLLLSSDAHSTKYVGVVNRTSEFVKQNNVPNDRIFNLKQLPKFKSHR